MLLTLTGCERSKTAQIDGGFVVVTVRDYRYDPQDVRIAAGRIVFGVHNEGPEPTNFRVRRENKDVVNITTMQPGERGLAQARLRPGSYVMYSSVGRHEVLGEYGRLEVTPRRASQRPERRTGTRRGRKRP